MKLLYSIKKELLLLVYDKAGLIILFVMPVLLVFIMTLIQENAFQRIKGSTTELLFVDEDNLDFSHEMAAGIAGTDFFKLTDRIDNIPITRAQAYELVADGKFQLCFIVEKGVDHQVRSNALGLLSRSIAPIIEGTAPENPPELAHNDSRPAVIIYLDPAVSETYRRSVINALNRLILGIEFKTVIGEMKTYLTSQMADMPGGIAADAPTDSAPAPPAWEPGKSIRIEQVFAGESVIYAMPTATQQNVPAWSLYAMFMIVIPLSGVFVQERDHGTLVRLRVMPVRALTILLGKVTAYVIICLLQFGLMMGIGIYGMPFFGIPALDPGSNYGAIFMASLASALAATGFGILVGVIARTQNQAAVFGSTFVVIAAAIGGIMVPVFLMPQGMRALAFLSPLSWGHTAFMDIFLRGAGLAAIAPDLLKLLVFFIISTALAVGIFLKKAQG